jgi:hypothetical protein
MSRQRTASLKEKGFSQLHWGTEALSPAEAPQV